MGLMGAKALIQDRPAAATAMIWAAVAVHAWAAHQWSAIPDLLKLATTKDAGGLYLGIAGIATMLAGFSGVILVFAMMQGVRRFSRLRISGGRRLEANWISPVASSFAASFGAGAAAVCFFLGHQTIAVWVFEGVATMAVHAAVRMLWLLRGLITAVRLEDQDEVRHFEPVDVAELIRGPR